MKLFTISNKIPALLLCGVLASGAAWSQIGNAAYYYKGQKLYQAKQYFEAAQVFEKYLKSEQPSRSTGSPFAIEKQVRNMPTLNMHEAAVYSLGECYRSYNDYTRALKYYALASKFKDKAFVLAPFWYGVLLRAQGQYEQAYTVLSHFTDTYSEMGPILLRADREVEDLKYIRSQLSKADSDYTVEQRFLAGNTSSYALSVVKNDTVTFTSIVTDSVAGKKGATDYTAGLFETVLNNGAAQAQPQQIQPGTAPQQIPLPDSPGIRQGLTTFSIDGKIMFFTRWAEKPGKIKAAIYRCMRTDTGWTTPVMVSGPVNINGYSSTQPFVTRDGKYLLFASDRPGGTGGYDLWYALLDSNYNSMVATNMGTDINTPGDDETPFYHEKSHTLVFSSNGRVGMGGFDIYSAKRGFDFSRWEQPLDAGVPVNSTKDDQYFVSTDEDNIWNTGYMSSDRSTDCCLAIFAVHQNNSLIVTGAVLDSTTHQPIAEANVIFRDYRHGDAVIGTSHTDTAGKYRIEMRNISNFFVGADKAGYRPDSNTLTVNLNAGANLYTAPDLLLAMPGPDKNKIREELRKLSDNTLAHFGFAKHDLHPAAYPNLDSLFALMNRVPDMVVEIGGYTDGKGSLEYNMRLAQSRVEVCVNYLLKKGLPEARVKGKAYGPCCPVAPETIDGKDNPAGRAKNRRVEYKLLN